jgi:GT2 family glycosyltransferase
MTAPLRLPGGSFVLPGNRWDLLDGMSPARPPSVSVVIPHFNAQRQLDRLLFALSRQTHPLTQLDVIVADDGSSEPPVVRAPAGLRVRVVGQADAGFRAAAARNLGAATATGEVLCFLDVDTVPEPGYLQALTRLPALAPDALVTGRRRHGDLAAMSDELYERWLGAAGPGPTELTEPQWLTERHERSGNLLRLGPDSYRFVLSAVLGCSRALFNELGGFDDTFIHYGGEDWEFAHRALSAAAVLAHVPDAVAWHDGPSWAERGRDPDPHRPDSRPGVRWPAVDRTTRRHR